MIERGRRILLVDDDDSILEVLGAILSRLGFEVVEASTPDDAIEQLAVGTFDAVVSDMLFEGHSGGALVLRAARERCPAAAVILMTGYPAVDSAVKAMKEGAADYIQKPVDGIRLAARIDEALRERALASESLGFGELVDILSRMVALTIERIDPYTAGHGARTRRYCELIAREIGLDVSTREKLELAAIAHDYGKIYLDDLTFLTKRGPLSPVEYAKVQRHAELGAQKLGNHERLRDVCRWIAEHHEKWDGTGYPTGKSGEEISLPGRILGAVEVFDSLATARSYKEAWDVGRVTDFFRSQRGRAFDPQVVDALLPKLERHGAGWMRQVAVDQRAAGVVLA